MTNTAIPRLLRVRHFLLQSYDLAAISVVTSQFLSRRLTYYHQNDQLRAAVLMPVSQESHRIMLGSQVRFLQPLSTADFTNDVHRPRLTSSSFDVSLRLVRRFLAPRYATVYTTLHPDVFAQIHVLVLFKIQVLRTQYLMPSMASRLRPLKTCKR